MLAAALWVWLMCDALSIRHSFPYDELEHAIRIRVAAIAVVLLL